MKERNIIVCLGLLTVAVHLINLGLTPLMADEGIRALVSHEMIQTGNYWVPTNFGDFYYKKPPLYNWILIGFFKLFGSYSEFVFRLPSVLSYFLLGGCIWWVSRNHIGTKAAWLAAFGFMLSGRLLTRDSMLGHIDITYSLVSFMGFFVIYHYHKQQRYWLLFLLSYLLAAAGTLMKGVPSISFQGLTLFVWFFYKKNWQKLISLEHASGIAIYLLVVGSYFSIYAEYNDPLNYWRGLYDQAEMRTMVARKWYESVFNLALFPLENLGHLFPTSLMALFALRKGIVKQWLKNDFLAFVFICLVVNIIPYWFSPGYYPRYLFMLYPLFYILISKELVDRYETSHRHRKVFESVFLVMGVLLMPALIASSFVPELRELWYHLPGLFAALSILGIGSWFWFKHPLHRVYWGFLFVLVFRLGFDLFVIPYRVYVEDSREVYWKSKSSEIIAASGNQELRFLSYPVINTEQAFYIGTAKNTVITTTSDNPEALILTVKGHVHETNIDSVLLEYDMHYQGLYVQLLKLKGR